MKSRSQRRPTYETLLPKYVSHDKSREEFSPWRSAREQGRIVFNPPILGNIKNDPRYTQLKHDAYKATPFHKQLNDLHMNRFEQLPQRQQPNMIFDYTNQDVPHQFDPETRNMRFNGNDTINNPLISSNHEGYHGLSLLDNKNYLRTIKNMRKQDLDPTEWNTVRHTIDPKGNLSSYKLPNLKRSHVRSTPFIGNLPTDNKTLTKITKNHTLADEFGAYIIENADNQLAFKPGVNNIKPFLSKEAGNIKGIYEQYDPQNDFPVVHDTLGGLPDKINLEHASKHTAISAGPQEGRRFKQHLKMYYQKQAQPPYAKEEKKFAQGGRVPNRRAMFFDIMQELLNRK